MARGARRRTPKRCKIERGFVRRNAVENRGDFVRVGTYRDWIGLLLVIDLIFLVPG